jgi:hypothetical protein
MRKNGKNYDGSDNRHEDLEQLMQPYYEEDELWSFTVDENAGSAMSQWEAVAEALRRARWS